MKQFSSHPLQIALARMYPLLIWTFVLLFVALSQRGLGFAKDGRSPRSPSYIYGSLPAR